MDQILRYLGYVPSKSDPDVWLRAETRPDCTEYYAYVLVYADDVMHIHNDPDTLMNCLSEIYRLKDGSVGEPYIYLGATIVKVQLDDVSVAW